MQNNEGNLSWGPYGLIKFGVRTKHKNKVRAPPGPIFFLKIVVRIVKIGIFLQIRIFRIRIRNLSDPEIRIRTSSNSPIHDPDPTHWLETYPALVEQLAPHQYHENRRHVAALPSDGPQVETWPSPQTSSWFVWEGHESSFWWRLDRWQPKQNKINPLKL